MISDVQIRKNINCSDHCQLVLTLKNPNQIVRANYFAIIKKLFDNVKISNMSKAQGND